MSVLVLIYGGDSQHQTQYFYNINGEKTKEVWKRGHNLLSQNWVNILLWISLRIINSLSPHSDQHQISPCDIKVYSTPEVMRIKDMITQGRFS